ncbi:MAG: PD-(D/E)XK nuclease family protein [Thermofilaceae archaeon]
MDKIVIKASDLGRLAMDDFCPRCFWFLRKYPIINEHPYFTPPPGIISILDSYTKNSVFAFFIEEKKLPNWLYDKIKKKNLDVKNIVKPKKFEVKVDNFLLAGIPDAILELNDGSFFIIDYKTSVLSEGQKKLFPLYKTQLLAYAYLGRKNGLEVKHIALVYLEPKYKLDLVEYINLSRDLLTLEFQCHVMFIEDWDPKTLESEIENMVRKVGNILMRESPPNGRKNCKGCLELGKWLANLSSKI